MEVKNSFWKNKKILVTGHNGFKGSWLTAILSILGSHVYGASLKPIVGPTIYNLAKIKNLMKKSIVIDIRNYSELENLIREVEPEIIFHLAAQPILGKSYSDPIHTYSTNIMGTINLFEAAKQIDSVKMIINVTSDKCYQNKDKKKSWFKENDKMGGDDPYSSSKGCAELISEAYRKSFNQNGICLPTARAGNVIGGGDTSKLRLIPDIFRSLENNEDLIVRSINSIRPWQHVLDPLHGYLELAELGVNSLKFSTGWNFGPKKLDALKVKDILREIQATFSKFKLAIIK